MKNKKKKESLYRQIKRRMYTILEKAHEDDIVSHIFDDFLMVLIVLNVTAVIIGTIPDFPPYIYPVLHVFEIFSVAIFTAEYFLRLWAITSEKKYAHPILGRLRYVFTPMAIVDLLSILPFYFPYFIPFDLREIRALRLFKFFRLFKFGRYLESLHTFANVIKRKREELILTFCLLSVLLVVASSVMYYAEVDAQPQNFSSIPAAMWWGIVTLTTVGYGDVYPITAVGKFLATIIAVLGIGVFAVPIAVLGSGFMEEVDRDKRKKVCPHCGGELHKNKIFRR